MPTQDISRYLNQPAKHYATVQMQQGRVILDSDWNERSMAEAEDLRATLLDITCSHGTPNDGFRVEWDGEIEITLPNESNYKTYNFLIGAGSFYVGGLRVALEEDVEFLHQPDWLQIKSDSANMPAKAVAGEGARYDLVYLRVWEQTVSATEDAEIREVALGGRDTSVRVRRMARVEVRPYLGQPTNCVAAFTELIGDLEVGATFNEQTGELVSDAKLTVSLTTDVNHEDPCAEPVGVAGGYVGAHNQAICVQLRGSNELIWGYDNASPLYRVSVQAGSLNKVTFITEPADLPAMPRAGQIVEILQWGAELSNGERVAERLGTLHRVATTYDPVTKELFLATDVDTDWIAWLDENTPQGESPFLFLRVWDQGDVPEEPSVELTIGYNTVEPIDILPGLAVSITPNVGRPGDYWIIGARPSTPEQVTPWELLEGALPHGPREFFAPLAIINFDVEGGVVTPSVTDCRLKMRPLCEGGCCTVSVGDDKQSFGQVSSLQDAIDLLATTGGKVCVLPGEHVGSALIDGENDIVIEGCGPRSRLMNLPPSSPVDETNNFAEFYTPVLHIRDAHRVQVRDLRIDAHSAVGALIEETEGQTCEDILINNVQVFATGRVDVPASVLELAAPCIAVHAASSVDIIDCEVAVDHVASLCSAIVLGGEKLRVQRTRVLASEYDGVDLRAMGGVQIRSGSRDVEIVGCEIKGGWGHGIALGHAELCDRLEPRYDPIPTYTLHYVQSKKAGDESHYNPALKWDCLEFDLHGVSLAGEEEKVWLPCGPVEQVRIHDNVIHRMGLSGISTSTFFSAVYDWETSNPGPVFIVAIDIDIARNLIEDNVQNTKLPESFAVNFDSCVGGICLAASICATIRENQILRNGADLKRAPVCGIGLIAAQAATIEDNRIVGNGKQLPAGSPLLVRGVRGGIVVGEVAKLRGYTFKAEVATGPHMPDPQTDLDGRSVESALVVRGNEVSQPVGKALWVVRGFGEIAVTGNSFETFGDPVTGAALLGTLLCWRSAEGKQIGRAGAGACVEIRNFAKALDVDWASPPPSGTPAESLAWTDVGGGEVDGGNVLVVGNTFSTSWSMVGGYGSSVLVSSLASVVFSSNVVNLDMQSTFNAGIAADKISQFNADILDHADANSFCMYSVYVGAKGSVQIVANRLEEGMFDCIFSLVAGPALLPVDAELAQVENAIVAAANVSTHMMTATLPTLGGEVVGSGNVAIFVDKTPDDPEPTYSVSATGGGAKVIVVVESV